MTIPDTKPITSALRLLFEPGDTFEIRILDAERAGYRRPHIESGYFDYEHIDDVPQTLAEISTALGVYVTMNPVNPALLARSTNHLGAARRNETTSNCDIVRRRWMLIDIDPARPAGISATDGEKDLAFSKATEIREGLTGKDWPSPIFMDSGNGYYLLYRIDIPPDDNELVHRCLQALQPLADDEVHIDLSVANSARICRVAGTWNRKGDNVPDRPHRLSEIVSAPESPEVVPVALMEELASKAQGAQDETARETPGKPVTTNGDRPGDDFNQRGDLVPILEAHGWQLTGKSKGNQLWRRPRKTSGKHSATFDGRTFYVFSSDAPPFEANRGYARFAVYAHLEHDGDFSAASSALASPGVRGRLNAG